MGGKQLESLLRGCMFPSRLTRYYSHASENNQKTMVYHEVVYPVGFHSWASSLIFIRPVSALLLQYSGIQPRPHLDADPKAIWVILSFVLQLV